MLGVKEQLTGNGLGKKLITAAEGMAKEFGCTEMCCEILAPIEWVLKGKEDLHAWYLRMGYVMGEPKNFE